MEKPCASVCIYTEYLENLDIVSLIVSTSSGLIEIRLVTRFGAIMLLNLLKVCHLLSEAKINEDNIKLMVTDRSEVDESSAKTIVVNFVDFKVDKSMSLTSSRNKKVSASCYDTIFK